MEIIKIIQISSRLLLLLIFPFSLYGQVDTNGVKVIRKVYHECVKSPEETEVPIYLEDITIVYPYIKTPNQKINKFINDTIQKMIGVYGGKDWYDSINCSYNGIDIETKPAQTDISYYINFINSKFISLTLRTDQEACCGANGTSHLQIPLTFNLSEPQILKVKDILNSNKDSILCKIVNEQLLQDNKDLIQSFNNDLELETLMRILDHPIAINSKGIIIYWTLSYGHGSVDAEINLAFDKYPELFNKTLVASIKNSSH
jgi:hypothetical protein